MNKENIEDQVLKKINLVLSEFKDYEQAFIDFKGDIVIKNKVEKTTKEREINLTNIFKELEDDLGIKNYEHGDLTSWAKQGVLLMNTSLTVEKGKPGSHLKFGWEQLTDQVIRSFNKKKKLYLCCGVNPQLKRKIIDEDKHFILEASHPSPFSCHKGFFGCNHFSRCNNFLKTSGKEEINWQIT